MNNQLSYCWLVDANIRASGADIDLPVIIINCSSSPYFFGISGAYLRIYRFVLVTEDNGRNIYGSAGFEALKRQQSACFCLTMGGTLSHFFQSGHALLSSSHNRYAYF